MSLELNLKAFFERAGPLLYAQRQENVQQAPDLTIGSLRTALAAIAGPLAFTLVSGAYINVWKVAGLGRNELRNASVLAWLLDPRGTHGRGDHFLRALFSEAATRLPDWEFGYSNLAGVSVRTELRPQASERDRVDIVIEGADFVTFIEVKIDSGEGHEQLERYAESAKAMGKPNWRLIYLSPTEARSLPRNTVHLNWRHVDRSLRDVARRDSNNLVDLLVRQFSDHIRQLF